MANIALKKITTRAKGIRKGQPGKSWKAAIKQASREYNNGSIGKVKKSSSRQTGTSNKRSDAQRKSKPPGKRKSKSGKVYYERRKNRTDKPGSMTGFKQVAKDHLAKALLQYELADTIKATKTAQKQKTKWRKVLKALV